MNHFTSSASATASASEVDAAVELAPVVPFESATATETVEAPASLSEAAIDRKLVARYLAGDESAFVEIMERHRGMVFNKALALLRNHGDAEEICQDTFVRAYRGLANFRGDSSLATWLYRVATNLARNRYWHKFRRKSHATLSLDYQLSDEGTGTLSDLIEGDTATPAQETAAGEFNDIVQQCIAMLPAHHRQALLLHLEKHFDYQQIATELKITVGTVKSRLARARQCLRALVNAHCPAFANAQGPADYFLARTNLTTSMRMAA